MTKLTLPVCSDSAAVRPIQADRLPVKDRAGETLFYVPTQVAERWLAEGRVKPLGTKTRIRAIQLLPEFERDIQHFSKPIPITAYMGQRYSHKHATEQNPEGVWTHKHQPRSLRRIFLRVVTDCVVKKQRCGKCGTAASTATPCSHCPAASKAA